MLESPGRPLGVLTDKGHYERRMEARENKKTVINFVGYVVHVNLAPIIRLTQLPPKSIFNNQTLAHDVFSVEDSDENAGGSLVDR